MIQPTTTYNKQVKDQVGDVHQTRKKVPGKGRKPNRQNASTELDPISLINSM